MKVKNQILSLVMLFPLVASAQDIYQLQRYSSEDLSGTARYVGMGGAMSALGADLSVFGTNPAGGGLFRHSEIATSFSFVTQEDAVKYGNKDKTHMSFDQFGFVYNLDLEDDTWKFLNIGFNYRKQKDFNQLINANFQNPNYSSQTWQMADLAELWNGPDRATPLTNMGYETYLIASDGEGTTTYNGFGASSSALHQAMWGSNQAFDINLSTNISDQYYIGLTVGAYNINQNSSSIYGEQLIRQQEQNGVMNYLPDGSYSLSNDYKVTGNGYNVKLGFIARPIQESPFRFGIAVSTPTYYDLKYRSYARLISSIASESQSYDRYTAVEDYHYNIHTPWKFNFSLGHVIANCLAIGAEYEYADYSSSKVTYDNGYDYDSSFGMNEDDDLALNREAEKYLKGVSTFKLGLEWMIDPMFSIRAGYNYVTSPIDKRAFPNQFINSASLDYSTSTDYMNVSDINRFTVGLGLNFGNFYADAACMYQHQKGDVYSFNTQRGNDSNVNEAPCQNINLSKTQILFTLGYRF